MTDQGAPSAWHTDSELAELLDRRARVCAAIRRFFSDRGSLEVETPTLGVCPGLDPHVHSLGALRLPTGEVHPMTSPEFFMKRLLTRGAPSIHQLARAFRAEELGPWHEPEFTLLEWYELGSASEALMQTIEALVPVVLRALGRDESTLECGPPGARRTIDLRTPYVRLPVADAFARFAGRSDALRLADEAPDTYFQLWVDHVEPGLALVEQPVFLTHFPRSQAALARLHPDAPDVAERVELVLGGIEVANGYAELTDAAEQRRRFEEELLRRTRAGEPTYPIDEDFLSALARGLPSCAGMALGLDRLLALCLGEPCIQRVLPFPRRASQGAGTTGS